VLNRGTINAYVGAVRLSAGEELTVDFSGDGLIRFVVDRTVFDQTLGPVTLTVEAVNNLLGRVVNSSGIIKAQSSAGYGGATRLTGGDTALAQAGEPGAVGPTGQVEGTAPFIGTIDIASAERETAPGRVLRAGERGELKGAIDEARLTSTTRSALFSGSAIEAGGSGFDAGGITGRSQRDTILALDTAGDESFVELSGKETLRFAGSVDARAPFGTAVAVLDPTNITVRANAGLTDVDQPTDVALQAAHDITVNNSTAAVNPGITLAMRAGRHIMLNADVSTNNALSLIAGGSITDSGVLSASAATPSTGGTTGTSSAPGDNTVRFPDTIQRLVSFNGPGVNDPLSNNPKDSALSNMAKLALPNDRSAFPSCSARTQMALNPTGFLLPPPLFRVEDGGPSTPPLNVAKGETDQSAVRIAVNGPGAGRESLVSGVSGVPISDTAALQEPTGGADPIIAAARAGSPTTVASTSQSAVESGRVGLTTPSWGTGSGALVIAANTTFGAESLGQNVANPPAPGASGGQININTAAGPIMAAARTDDSTAGASRTQAQPSSGQRLKVLGHGLVRFAVDATPVGSEGRTADMRARVVNTSGVTKATSLLSRGGVIQLVASEALALPLPAAPSRSY